MASEDPSTEQPYGDAVVTAMRAIERYLDAQPQASDTPSGVRDWWLRGLGQPLGTGIVDTALERLVAEGKVEKRALPGGTLVYGRRAAGHPRTP